MMEAEDVAEVMEEVGDVVEVMMEAGDGAEVKAGAGEEEEAGELVVVVETTVEVTNPQAQPLVSVVVAQDVLPAVVAVAETRAAAEDAESPSASAWAKRDVSHPCKIGGDRSRGRTGARRRLFDRRRLWKGGLLCCLDRPCLWES